MTLNGECHRLAYGKIVKEKLSVITRVARWHIFKPKKPIWVNSGGTCNGRCWNILGSFGIFCGHLV
jgi:hypothetical protein